jgi:hypothetical protein
MPAGRWAAKTQTMKVNEMKALDNIMTYADMRGHDEEALLARRRNPECEREARLSGLLVSNIYSLYGYMQRSAAHPFTKDFLEASK